MLVVACVKQVPDTTQVKVDPVTGTLVREGVPFIMNPFDTHALEESLRLKDKYGMRVAVISMGPPNAEVTLKKCLAVGADEVVLLSDRAFGGAIPLLPARYWRRPSRSWEKKRKSLSLSAENRPSMVIPPR
jgi:electron transfer flavoprotein beta subunit